MKKHPTKDEYKITDYTDFIGWVITSVTDTGRKVNKESICALILQRVDAAGKVITRQAYCEERYLPVFCVDTTIERESPWIKPQPINLFGKLRFGIITIKRYLVQARCIYPTSLG